jgi:metallophosphoesterase (TIGR00282 family)
MKILFIGVIVGQSGKKAISRLLPELKKEAKIDFVVANAECACKDGTGIGPKDVTELRDTGIDCITSGEGVWRKKEMVEFLEENSDSLLRPLNYPPGVPGCGALVYPVGSSDSPKSSEQKIGVINLLGRSFLANIDCPFRAANDEIEKMSESTKLILVDFHAQTTAEKQAFGWWVDGRVSAVFGTHVRVQTTDERILPEGTGYITDVGMTGVHGEVCGMRKDLYTEYFLKGIPVDFKSATGRGELDGVVVELDDKTGKCLAVRRISALQS